MDGTGDDDAGRADAAGSGAAVGSGGGAGAERGRTSVARQDIQPRDGSAAALGGDAASGSDAGPRSARRRGPYAKSAERRTAIVDAAFEVFAARGYRGGSLQEVADRVGMSQTSLFHYFPTKRDLLLAVLAKRDVAEARLPEPVDPARLEALGVRPDAADDDLAAGVMRRALANEGVPGLIELYTVLLGEAASEDHPAREYFATRYAGSRAGWADDLRGLAKEGRLRDGVDPDRAAASVVALWDGLQTEWLFDRAGVDVAACLRDYLDLIVLPPRD